MSGDEETRLGPVGLVTLPTEPAAS
jgi:hypothetical protein